MKETVFIYREWKLVSDKDDLIAIRCLIHKNAHTKIPVHQYKIDSIHLHRVEDNKKKNDFGW